MTSFKAAIACAATVLLAGCAQAVAPPHATFAATFRFGACPAGLGTLSDVAAPRHAGTGLLDAHLEPSAATVCEYGSVFNQGTGARRTLAEQFDLTAMPARELASAVGRIDTATSAATSGCPSDPGNVTIIVFGYRDAAPVDLWWHSTGCQTIDDGTTTAHQVANDSFADFQAVFEDVVRDAGRHLSTGSLEKTPAKASSSSRRTVHRRDASNPSRRPFTPEADNRRSR